MFQWFDIICLLTIYAPKLKFQAMGESKRINMSESIKASLPLFFSQTDEKQFELAVRKLIPEFNVVDGAVWPTTKPNIKSSLAACESNIVFLWDPKTCPSLPFLERPDGRAEGPTSGIVIQYIRPRRDAKILTSGEMGIGYKRKDEVMAKFVKTVWEVAKSMNSAALCSFDKKTDQILKEHIRMYVVGPDTVRLSKEEGVLLKHFAADHVFYRAE
jgi:hypothetical protein